MRYWLQMLAKGWFVPIYLAIVVLAVHMHVFTGRFCFGLAAASLFTVVKEHFARRRARYRPGPANDG